VDEPNSPFTLAEKNAIINYVQHGGGLLMISDHVGADRNNDGWDAVRVWDDLIRNNSYGTLLFGFKVDSTDITETTSNILTAYSTNPILNGPQGQVSQLAYHDGATFTLYPSYNSTVKGLIWRTGYSQGNTQVMCAMSNYGSGRVFCIGDSSPQDDGTGSSGHTLYSSWLTEVNGNHARLHLNACLWLAKVTGVSEISETGNGIPDEFHLFQNFPNPFNPVTKIRFDIVNKENRQTSYIKLIIYDMLGKEAETIVNEDIKPGSYEVTFDGSRFSSGMYYYRLISDNYTETKKMTLLK